MIGGATGLFPLPDSRTDSSQLASYKLAYESRTNLRVGAASHLSCDQDLVEHPSCFLQMLLLHQPARCILRLTKGGYTGVWGGVGGGDIRCTHCEQTVHAAVTV